MAWIPLGDLWQDSLDKIRWMKGDAITSYFAQADARIEALRQLKGSSEGASEALQVVAVIVTFVHSFLRDILSSLVGAIISWVLQSVLSLGTLIPWVWTQIAIRISSVVGKCSRYVTALTKSGTELGSLPKALMRFGDDVLQFLNKITPNPSLYVPRHGGAPAPPVSPGPWLPPPGWRPNTPRRAKTPWDNLGEIPGDLPWRDSGVNAGTQAGQNATNEDND